MLIYKEVSPKTPEGRTLNIKFDKLPKDIDHNTLKSLIEQYCDVDVAEVKARTKYKTNEFVGKLGTQTIIYSGRYIVEGVEIETTRQPLFRYKKGFRNFNKADNLELENFLRLIYGSSFKLTHAHSK